MTLAIQNAVSSHAMGFEPLLNLYEASAILRRSHWALRLDIRHGRLNCVRIGKNIFVEASELRRVIAEGRSKR